jgi:hypothetical protein
MEFDKFKSSLVGYRVKNVPVEELIELDRLFMDIDRNNDGFLEQHEFAKGEEHNSADFRKCLIALKSIQLLQCKSFTNPINSHVFSFSWRSPHLYGRPGEEG